MTPFDSTTPQYQHRCPKTGKPIGRPRLSGWAKWLFPVVGVLSLLWFLIRVLPKPSRAAYPCQRAAAPLASSFVLWLLGMGGCTLAFRHAKHTMRKARFVLGGVLFVLGLASAILSIAGGPNGIAHAILINANASNDPSLNATIPDGPYVSIETPNSPIGVGQGIHPGRVAWVYDPAATNGTVTWDNKNGYFWDESHCYQSEVNTMVPKAVCYLTGDQDPATAWNDIFHYFNRKHNKGDIGYQPGEKIAIKINLSATLDFNSPLIESAVNGNADQNYKLIDPTNPQYFDAIPVRFE